MGAITRGQLPKDLSKGRSRFQAWRRRRELGSRIPKPLWALAVRLARAHGICRTASVLRLDYYSLKKRVAAAAGPSESSSPAFVELPAPMVVSKHCLFELDNGAGTTMRVQLVGYDAVDVVTLSRSIWNG